MIKVGWQTLFRITLPPKLPNIYSEWLWTAWLKIYKIDTDAWKSFILKVFVCELINHSKKKWSSDILHWVLLEISEYVSDKADAIRPPVTEESESWPWLTRSSPGVTWSGLTPALATSCRVRSPSSIHRPRWETLTTYYFLNIIDMEPEFYDFWFCIGVTSRLVLTNCSVLDARKWFHLVLDNESNCPIK